MMASTQPNDQKYKLFFIPSGAWTLKGLGSDLQEHKEVIINILRYFTVGRLHERAKYFHFNCSLRVHEAFYPNKYNNKR